MTHVEQVLAGGLVIGVLFGALGQLSGFCLMRGLRDWWTRADRGQIRLFAAALAVAILGAQLLEGGGWINLSRSIYLQSVFSGPSLLLGGALFGYGMVMANGCGARALVLLGSGNLRSFVVLVCLGLAAYAALSGVLAPLRLQLAAWGELRPGLAVPSLRGAAAEVGLNELLARWLPVLLLCAALLGFALRGRVTLRLLAGAAIGALIPLSWWVTGVLGRDVFDPVALASLTFVAPIGEGLQYLMLATGMPATFGVSVVAGVPLGGFAMAVLRGGFHWQGFETPQRMLRSMGGGALMGIGGALAFGCSIGQGLSGLSTLALASFLAAGGILLGAFLGLRGPLRLATV